MKKTLTIVLLAMLVVAMVIPCTVSAAQVTTPTTGRVNVVAGEMPMMYAVSNNMHMPTILTDGVIASPIGGAEEYINKAFCAKADGPELTRNPTIEVKLTNGQSNMYVYTYDFSELYCNVDGFSIFFANHTKYDDGSNAWWQLDTQFAFLVSTDGGATYTEAYRSPERQAAQIDVADIKGTTATKKGYTVLGGGAQLVEEGGLFTNVAGKIKDGEEEKDYWYRYFTYNFDKTYEKVTNVMYACIVPRANYVRYSTEITYEADGVTVKKDSSLLDAGLCKASDSTGVDNITDAVFYYVARISEIEVYGTKLEKGATTAEVTTEAPKTEPVVTTAAPTTTEAPKTEAPVVTTGAPAATEAPKAEKKGCGGSIAVAGVAVVMTLGCAIIRKKH